MRNINNPNPVIRKINNKKDLISFFGDEIDQENFDNILYGKEKEQYKKFVINKATGKPRTLHAVPPKIKHIQRIALDKLQAVEQYQPSSYAHGFVLKRSIVTNAIPHRRKKRIIKMDLKDFFPSIHEDRVRDMFMGKPFSFGKEAATTMAQLSCLNDGSGILPQGGTLSPYVANMLCLKLDKKLAKVAIKYHCNFTRYADDITFSTNDVSEDSINNLIKETSNFIESEHFVVNAEKTKVLTPNRRQVVTGIIVNDGVNVNRRYIRNLRATIKNCELFGIDSQTQRFVFKDHRCSGTDKFDGSNGEIKNYFLHHLFGKITFFGNVVLSNNQDLKNEKSSDRYRRVQTYEEILYRFYDLIKNVNTSRRFKKSVMAAVNNRPNLSKRLSFAQQGVSIRGKALKEYRSTYKAKNLKDDLELVTNINQLRSFIGDVAETNPSFFNTAIPIDLDEAKEKLGARLSFPPVNLDIATGVLQSLVEDEGLKKIVHAKDKNEVFTVKDCYKILREYYDSVFYYLPKCLQQEFDNWKDALTIILLKHGESYNIDVIHDSMIANATNELKINTRFGGGPDSSDLLKHVKKLVSEIKVEDGRVDFSKKLRATIYTHVPSIVDSVSKVLESMLKHTTATDTIFIDLIKDDRGIELRMFNESKKTIDSELLNNRDFAHGKISSVVQLTNGLCKYWIEATPDNGKRKIINMHNNSEIDTQEMSDLKCGFAHRFIFKK
jgi:retron-type reverse transcriptase